ncbi:LamG domain-containing protein [Candidatus Nanosalina sp. VS9-1]|uniref:LamG domain-containing protein n=1 Tax=Candidatus Nanosalina sp. VS9-1 TaxID=3388566 RepID=UPI0039E169CC
MPKLSWNGDDFQNPQDSSGTATEKISGGGLEQGYRHGSLTQGLVAYYPMDSGSGTTAVDKALGNDGTVNGASWSSSSKIGSSCLSFDGTDDVVRCFSTGFSDVSELTVALWVNIASNSGDYRALCSATEDPYNDYETGFTLDQGSNSTSDFSYLNFEFAGDGSGAVNLKSSTHSFGQWVHVTIQLSSSQAVLFINGTREGSRSNDGTPLKLNDIRIGARAYDNNNPATNNIERGYLDGRLDDVRIYDRSLSAPEIKALYQLRRPSKVSSGDTLN